MKKISALAVAGVFVASLAGTAFAEGTDLKLSGEIRIRDQWTNNKDYNANIADQKNMIIQRTRVNVDAKIDERVKAYVSIENSRNFGSSATTGGTTSNSTVIGSNNPATGGNNASDTVSLYQGYVVVDKLFDQPLMFKAGRTKIALGNQRLAGANDWGAGQAFDSLILGYNIEAASVTAFSLTGADKNSVDSDANGTLNGIYATIKSVPATGIDVYAIQKSELANTDTSTGQSFLTYGVRANGAAMNIDWDVEAALQSGDSSTGVKKNASAIWLLAGYSLPEVSKLRVGAEYDMISGDKTGGDDQGFDFLYPTKHSNSNQHSNYGITDIIEGQIGGAKAGLIATSLNVSAEPVDGLKLLAEYWNFSQNKGENDKALGNEVNLQAWYAVTKSTGVHAYYAQFTPTTDLSSSTKTDAATDLVLQLQVAF